MTTAQAVPVAAPGRLLQDRDATHVVRDAHGDAGR
jgi:hypothetical protein